MPFNNSSAKASGVVKSEKTPVSSLASLTLGITVFTIYP